MKDKKMNAPSSLQSISLGTLKSEFNLDIWNPEINKAALTEINKEAKNKIRRSLETIQLKQNVVSEQVDEECAQNFNFKYMSIIKSNDNEDKINQENNESVNSIQMKQSQNSISVISSIHNSSYQVPKPIEIAKSQINLEVKCTSNLSKKLFEDLILEKLHENGYPKVEIISKLKRNRRKP